jgi:hypothetical protein
MPLAMPLRIPIALPYASGGLNEMTQESSSGIRLVNQWDQSINEITIKETKGILVHKSNKCSVTIF